MYWYKSNVHLYVNSLQKEEVKRVDQENFLITTQIQELAVAT